MIRDGCGYYHPDHLGSTQYVTDQDQELSQHVEYLPSGELWVDESDSRFQNRQPYLFNGKELDLSTGLYYYGARSYEPRLGVWLSPDPILDQYMVGRINGGVYRPSNLGLYTYVSNNPVVLVDPNGQFDDATRKFLATLTTAALVEPTPAGEIILVGAVVVGSIGYAGYLIYDAAANGNPPKPPESFPIPEDTTQDVAEPSPPPPPPAAGGGGAKEPPKPPAAVSAEPPEEDNQFFKGKVNPFSLEPNHELTRSKREYAKLKKYIAEHGMRKSVKFVEHNGKRYVVDGHHRLRIAKELKLPEIPAEQVSLPYRGYKTTSDLVRY
ncbi:RHS repeat-associated core domain-containing protein [Sorangium cellulosum]|uniref:RHS repeat-associated core and ParB-like nuclease domain-containing protein n=1 Tax=Sorangium cellulosum TaxID=56 RepID=UPI003D9A3CF8